MKLNFKEIFYIKILIITNIISVLNKINIIKVVTEIIKTQI